MILVKFFMKSSVISLAILGVLGGFKNNSKILQQFQNKILPNIPNMQSRCTIIVSKDEPLSYLTEWFHSQINLPRIIYNGDALQKPDASCPDLLLLIDSDCTPLQRLKWHGEGNTLLVSLNTPEYCVREFSRYQMNLITITQTETTKLRRKTFSGEILQVGIIHYPPFIFFPESLVTTNYDTKLNEDVIKVLDGIEYQMLHHMAEKFNFTMDIFLKQELELWGMDYANGSASGLIGMIKNGSIDVAAGGFNHDSRYLDVAELLHPYRKILVKFLSPKRESTPNWLSLVKPFRLDTWCGIVGITVAGALSLYLAKWTEDGVADFSLSFLVSLSVLTQQGDFTNQWLRGVRRPLLLGLQMSILLLGACYCGLLVSVLTLEAPASQIDSAEMLARSDLIYTDIDDIFPGQLALSDDPHIRTVLSRLQMSHSWQELTTLLNGGHHAFILECLDTGYLCIQERFEPTLLQRMHLSREFVLTSEIALAFARGFPLRRQLDLEVLRLVQSGVLSVWEQRVVTATPERDMTLLNSRGGLQTRPLGPVPLSLVHLGGPFLLLMAGLALAVIALACEILITRISTFIQNLPPC